MRTDTRFAPVVCFCVALCVAAQVDTSGPGPNDLRIDPSRVSRTITLRTSGRSAADVEKSIRELRCIDQPDYGVSPTMSGTAFTPISGTEKFGSGIMMNHALHHDAAFVELVRLGPEAIPSLLRHVSDATPTRLVMQRFDAMWYGHELWGNPANPREWAILAKHRKEAESSPFALKSHTVTVGDICFVILGQIVGRPYQAARYQPTACMVINSPTHDPSLAAEMRTLWGTPSDARRMLLESLLRDYGAEGVEAHMGSDGWERASELQVGAALRLLYYFPAESADLIAARAAKLHIERTGPAAGEMSSPTELEALSRREVANGVRADDFVRALSWTDRPEVEAALEGIILRTGDPDIMAAAVRGIRHRRRAAFVPRIVVYLESYPDAKAVWIYGAYVVLQELGRYWAADSEPIFRTFIRDKRPIRLNTVCAALAESRGSWARRLLRPMLADSRPVPGALHFTSRHRGARQVQARVCDEAAFALGELYGHRIDSEQSVESLDREIQWLRQRGDRD